MGVSAITIYGPLWGFNAENCKLRSEHTGRMEKKAGDIKAGWASPLISWTQQVTSHVENKNTAYALAYLFSNIHLSERYSAGEKAGTSIRWSIPKWSREPSLGQVRAESKEFDPELPQGVSGPRPWSSCCLASSISKDSSHNASSRKTYWTTQGAFISNPKVTNRRNGE